MAVLVSFLGFVLENCWLALSKGYVDNRNMNLPFLLGYGLVIIGAYILVGTPDSLRINKRFNISLGKKGSCVLYFLMSVVLISLGELILGTFIERKFGFEYWNYTWIPLHITKYTSVPTSLGLGALLTLFMKYGFTPLMDYIHNMPATVVKVVGIALMALITADFIMSFATMFRTRKLYVKWVINLRGSKIGLRP